MASGAMKYRVVIEEPAHEDLEAIVLWLAQHSQSAARKWYQQVRKAIRTLDQTQQRCSFAPENKFFTEEIRHLLYGRRRYIY